MPEVTVTLEDVESKDVNTKRGLGTVYRLKGSDGRTYTTFDREIATKAAELRGKTVVFDYVESKNGEWVNYNLNGVKAGAFATTPAPAQGFPTETPQGSTPNTDRDTSIARAVALKAAVTYVVGANPEQDPIALADEYVEWLLTGVSRSSDDTTTPAESLVQF